MDSSKEHLKLTHFEKFNIKNLKVLLDKGIVREFYSFLYYK